MRLEHGRLFDDDDDDDNNYDNDADEDEEYDDDAGEDEGLPLLGWACSLPLEISC